MFSKTAIFAISALAFTANGQTSASYLGCDPVYPACPTGYFQTESCECCPVEGEECQDKYFGQFCSGSGTSAQLNVYKLPLSCPKRQAAQTCTAKCANGTGTDSSKFQIRQDTCECCPTPGMESNAFFADKYYDATNKVLKFDQFPKSCPQQKQRTATCSKTCNAPETIFQPSCECCPDTTKSCKDTEPTSDTFKAKYCNTDGSLKFDIIPASCPQNFNPALRTTPATCPEQFCLQGTYRPMFSCDCCPYVGTECQFGDKYCTNGVVDKDKIPASCTASRGLPALCTNTFCPTSYTVGQNCKCCPIKGQECTSQYGDQFCDASGKIILSKIPDGCPSKDTFNTCTNAGATTPLSCDANTFKTLACDCCPFEGKECDPVYNGLYCTNNQADLTKIGKSCPQQTTKKDCSKSSCAANFLMSAQCECCPEPGNECDYSKYGSKFCDQTGNLLKQNIPLSCQQQKADIVACTPERYQLQIKSIGVSPYKYVNSQCDVCPIQGKECEAGNEENFCMVIKNSKITDLSRIPQTCPQTLQIMECDNSLYTKNALGQCCPLVGKESNSVYNGRFALPDGQLIYKNIPAGCPQLAPKAGCLECAEGTFMPSDAKNCECCPYPGFECDTRYGGKYCDVKGNLVISAIPQVCPTKKVCDDRYYWTGNDKFTCCPFEGRECDPVYSNQYCPADLKNPSRLGTEKDSMLTFNSQCQKPNYNNYGYLTCTSVYYSFFGYVCCPIKGLECSSVYSFEQYCTNNKLDFSKVDYRCPIFEDICNENDFRKKTYKNQNNVDVFGACCPKFGLNKTSGAVTADEACKPEYGFVQNVSGGIYCNKDGTVRDDLFVCTVWSGGSQPTTTSPQFLGIEYASKSDSAITCPKPGFECYGVNNTNKYCDSTTGLPDDTKINALCDNKPSVLSSASVCNVNPTAHKFLVQVGPTSCVQCPIIGKECDDTKYAYDASTNKSEYCDRKADNVDQTKFSYTLNIMSIPPQCPQRAAKYSLAPSTHFSLNPIQTQIKNVFCPDPVMSLTFGAFYSTWDGSKFTFNADGIPVCKNLLVNCPACGQKEIAVLTGSTQTGSECVCCPVDLNNLRDPVYKDKYYKDGQAVAGALKEQCKLPAPTNTGQYKCPQAVACGAGWTASTTTCECCPDMSKYTDTWCTTEKTPSELSNLLCDSINSANAKRKAYSDLIRQIPMACTSADITNFPKLPQIDFKQYNANTCPQPGTECDPTRSISYCTAPEFNVKTGSIQKLDFTKIDASCPQKYQSSICAANSCEQNYVATVNPLSPNEPSQCQCCPVLNKECSEVYNGQFCKDGKMIYENIPSICPQFEPLQSCNQELFDKIYTGATSLGQLFFLEFKGYWSCCPKEGIDCIPEFNNFFCNFDGSFNKQNYDMLYCPVPACKSVCSGYYISNGCDCCPIPGFELDQVYFDAYKGFDGSANVPKECQTLNLFPVNAWQTISKFTSADFAKSQTVNGLPPVGTSALGEVVYGSVENFYNQKAKPIASIQELEAIGVNSKINKTTKGAVFGIEAVNLLYKILSTPRDQIDKTLPTALQTAIDAQITAMAAQNYAPYPPTIFDSLGVKDKNEFAALSQVQKRSKLMTFWFMKPFTAGSKFGQQDRFQLGETSWISATSTDLLTAADLSVEYILSQTVATLNDRRNQMMNTKNILAATAKLADPSLEKFIKLDMLQLAYQITKTNIQQQNPTMDQTWHLAKAPKTTTNKVDSLQKLMQYSVYWFDQKYPGLQVPVTAISGEIPADNAARVTVYEAFIAACITANIKADSVEDTFPQYRMEKLMKAEIDKYQLANVLWDYTRPPVKYTSETVDLYAKGFQASLTNGMINDVIDMAREMESWPTKYKDALPANPTISSLWADNVLGGILTEISIDKTTIGTAITEKNALFKVAWQLYTTGRTPQDAFFPTYPQTLLDTYGLKADVLAIYNMNPLQGSFVYQTALDFETDLKTNETVRAADLLLAFDKNADAVKAATLQQKAGKLALFFLFLNSKPATFQANVGVIKPKPYSRYFDSPTQAEKTAIDALFITQADLLNEKYNSFSVAAAIQAKVISTDLALASPTYPTTFAEAVNNPAYTGNNTAKAAYLAYYIASAELGLKARSKPEIEAYFPGYRVENIVKAKIDESDLKAIDDRITAELAQFRYGADTLSKFGLTETATKAQVAKIVFADELAQKKILFYFQLYNEMTLVQHLQTLGVTEDELQEINLSFDQVNADSSQWNSEAIGNMLFTNRYGKICDLNAVSCTTGWASTQARAEIVFPLGLSRKTAMAKGYSLLEVLQLARNYRQWSNNNARVTNDLSKLYAANALGAEAVKNLYFDGVAKTENDLITLGAICAPSGNTTVEPVVSGTTKVCDYYTNPLYPLYLAKSRADTLLAPRTNIDVLLDSFKKGLNKTTFDAQLTAAAVAVNGAGTNTHADYSFEKFLAAVAQFPFFCNVDENKQNTLACEQQVVGLLTFVGANTNGFKDSVIANPSCDGTVFNNACQNWPDVETVEYHWIMKLVKNAGIAVADAIYPAWGAGAIKGPAAYLDFFHTYPNTNSVGTAPNVIPGKPVFEQPKKVADLLTAQPELNWATALYRWFQPNKVNTVEKVTETADVDQTKLRNYFYVEDSYLTPSFDMWMLGNIGPETVLKGMFPTSYGGLRGILKNLYGADCHSSVTDTTNKPIDKALKIYAEIIKIYGANTPSPDWTSINKDCLAVTATTAAEPIGRWDRFNRKNYYSPVLTTIEPETFAVRNFQGTPGQCFNVHIETPFTIFGKDSYARCVALKLMSTFGTTPVNQAATNFVGEPGFTFQF